MCSGAAFLIDERSGPPEARAGGVLYAWVPRVRRSWLAAIEAIPDLVGLVRRKPGGEADANLQ
jgi:hypothetical protein